MKYLQRALVLLALIGGGCIANHQELSKSWKSPEKAPPPPPAPVTATQINRENAHNASQALWDEMDRQAQNELLPESKANNPPAKK